jgi:hypothetical protein
VAVVCMAVALISGVALAGAGWIAGFPSWAVLVLHLAGGAIGVLSTAVASLALMMMRGRRSMEPPIAAEANPPKT